MSDFAEWVEFHEALCGRIVNPDHPQSEAVLRLFYAEFSRYSKDDLMSASRAVVLTGQKLWTAGEHINALKHALPSERHHVIDFKPYESCRLCGGTGYVQVELIGKTLRLPNGRSVAMTNTVSCRCPKGATWADAMEHPEGKSTKTSGWHMEWFRPVEFDPELHRTGTSDTPVVTREEAEAMCEFAKPPWGQTVANLFLSKRRKINADGSPCEDKDLEKLRTFASGSA